MRDSIIDAAATDDVGAVTRMLAEGVSPNEQNHDGRTALHVAAAKANAAMFALLVKAGGDVDLEDAKGTTPRFTVLLTQDKAARGEMIQAMPPPPATPRGPLPWSIEVAISRRQTSIVQMLLSLGADPNAKGTSGAFPLLLAAQKGDEAIVKALLEKGARADVADKDGLGAIHIASLAGNTEVVGLLLEKGVDINAKAATGETSLYFAAWAGRTALLKFLLDKGANPSIGNSKGVTPYQAAVQGAQAEVVKLLEGARSR